MSYIDQLRKSRDKAQVAYQEFALSTKHNKDGLFCFFEGKDHGYYVPRIKIFINKYYTIKCGGRDRLLEVYKLIKIHQEYDQYKKAFFIDRDFNEALIPHDPPIFETPCYSIENFYVSINVFEEIVKNEFNLSEVSNPNFQVCIQLFRDRQQEFHQAVTLLNAWYACLIKIKNITGKSTGVNLADVLPKNFIEFTLDSIVAKYNIQTIKDTYCHALEVSENMLNEKLIEFNRCEYHKIFRGKYEMFFLLKIVELILQDSLTTQKYIKEKIKFTFNDKLSIEQAITVFSAYAETPDSLMNYLQMIV